MRSSLVRRGKCAGTPGTRPRSKSLQDYELLDGGDKRNAEVGTRLRK